MIAMDCRHYLGDRPCGHQEQCRCRRYEPMGYRVLIIKLGALGDVVRTTCVLPTLKRMFPQSHITWTSSDSGVRILKNHPLIDRWVEFDAEGILILTGQKFDLVLSLDKEAGPAALCNAVTSAEKRGMGLSGYGTVVPCNPECEEYFQLGLDNELKFRGNRRSYPELIHRALGLEYAREPYRLYYDDESLSRARAMFDPWRAKNAGPVVGLNTGAGSVFANKSPDAGWWVDLARRLLSRSYTVVLLGGPGERERNDEIKRQAGSEICDTGIENSESEFVAIVDQCDVVVTGDTLGLHVAVARGVGVVGLFGPTCEQEIDLFDRGIKIVSPSGCGPCYRRRCEKTPGCMDQIRSVAVAEAVEKVVGKRSRSRLPAS
jgi:ADP-heptose:LPS heptosyltransferase